MKYKILVFCLLLITQLSVKAQSLENESITIGSKETFHSDILNEERLIFIQTPNNYHQMDNIPLVFVLDADSQFNQTASTIDYISNGAQGNDIIPSSIVIGITNPNRNYDFTPVKGMIGLDSISISNTGGASKFLSFITDELIPHLDSMYNTCRNRTIIGHSLGGLFVFHALLNKPEYFDNYLAIDPAIGFSDGIYLDKVLKAFDRIDFSSENLYFASADNRPKGMSDEELEKTSHQFLFNTDKSHLVFQNHKKSSHWKINLRTVHYPHENHYSVPFRATYDGMKFFYNYYKFNEMSDLFFTANSNSEIDMVNKLKKHYKIISENMGCKAKPQLGFLNSWAWGYGEDSRTRETAHDMFLYSIELYPHLPETYSNYGYFLYSKGDYSEAVKQYDKSLGIKLDDSILDFKNEIINEMTKHNNR